MNPSIAICMATFDPRPQLLRRQIESICAQTQEDWVCLISDDDSEPEAFAAITEAVGDDPRFQVLRNPRRLGVYHNFERAIAAVPPETALVALADQDDRWEPDKLASLRRALEGGATLAYSDMRVTDSSGRLVAPTFWTSRRNNHDQLGTLMIANSITGAASLLRRELLDYALPFPDPSAGLMHDHWLAIVAMSLGEVAYVDRPLYDYVQHPAAALGHEAGRARLQATGPAAPGSTRWGAERAIDFMRRGHEALQGVRATAELMLQRGGDAIPPAKRRVLRRCSRLDRSPAGWGWLAWLMARSAVSGSSTMGAERFLLAGALWQVVPGKSRLARLPQGR